MGHSASASQTDYEGYPAISLRAPEGELEATFCPQLGMVGCSLRQRGDELLGQRGGLSRYAAAGSTMGIPLLHPWANRMSGFSYAAAGREVHLDRRSPLLHLDPNGLPIHGLLAASPYWEAVSGSAGERAAELSGGLDFAAHPDLLEAFPFPHELRMHVTLEVSALTIGIELAATGDVPVPVSFGFHPYFRLPDVPRRNWWVELPVRRRLGLDERMIPTGESEPVDIAPGPLGDRTFDDAFCDLPERPVFVLAGPSRRIEVVFVQGYRFTQVYAPPDQDVICFEPMTAPTNALVTGRDLTLLEPGKSYSASFRISVA